MYLPDTNHHTYDDLKFAEDRNDLLANISHQCSVEVRPPGSLQSWPAEMTAATKN